MDEATRERIALWRLTVLGPLCSARLEHGDLRALLNEAAAREYADLNGRLVRVAARTVEDWHYAYQLHGLAGLKPRMRSDRGHSRAIAPHVGELLLRAKREKPRRSIRRLIRMLERAGAVHRGELSRSSVHRLLQQHGVSSRPVRGPGAERRSFLPDHVGDLWIGDALHGPLVLAADGKVRKSYLLSQLDGASRYLVHSYLALSEDAVAQEYGFRQAVEKHGCPRAYYVDLGAAYVATSLRVICAELRTQLIHTAPKDCEAKGAIERWHRTWREEVEDELPGQPMPLSELNAIHYAWLGSEYHARPHDTTGRIPREHFLEQVEHLRPVPHGVNVEELFLHRATRVVRKDGTVRWGGGYLEVRSELTGQEVELRFDPGEPKRLPRVFVDGRFCCDTVPLDRQANNGRVRRRPEGEPAANPEPSGLEPLKQISAEHYRRTRGVGAPLNPPDDAHHPEDHDDDEE